MLAPYAILTLLACPADVSACQRVRLETQAGCISGGQQIIVSWIEDHPGYVVQGWTCGGRR